MMQKRMTEMFSGLLILCFVVWLALLVANPYGVQRDVFFAGTADLFADFFNLLRYISERDPYFNEINGLGEKAYLPISYLILYPFSQLDAFGILSIDEARASHLGLVSVLLWSVFSTLFLSFGLRKLSKNYGSGDYLIFSLMLSSVYLFAVERGNMILVSGACICVFLACHDSPSRLKRLAACFCLALAVGLKVYPVLFGLILLQKKDYKSILVSGSLAFVVIFLPFFFFNHGIENIPQLMSNLKVNAASYSACASYPRFGLQSMTCFFMRFINHYDHVYIFAAKWIAVFLALGSVAIVVFLKDRFLSVALIALVVVNFPENSAFYTGVYLFPVVVMFLATMANRSRILNSIFGISFLWILSPIQIPMGDGSVNCYISQLVVFCLWLLVIVMSLALIRKELLKSKNTCVGEIP